MKRLLAVGASEEQVCGVRDHARVLSDELALRGAQIERVWWERGCGEQLEDWLERSREAAERLRPDWILWHYSVFTYAHRGFPVYAPRAARLLRGLGPVALIVHEYAYPFGVRGWRGLLHAVTQRAAFAPVLRASAACVVTVERRRRAIARAPFLPRRPLAVVPVFSNLPEAEGSAVPAGNTLGLFGFGLATPLAETVAAAIRALDAILLLIGSPGPESAAAEAWRRALAAQGCADRLAFTGVLEPGDLAAAIASVDVALFADPAGPASRKGTLAALLAAGRPIVAIDGPDRWQELVDERAVRLAPPDPDALAGELGALLEHPQARREQGRRAAEFYGANAAPGVAAESLLRFLDEVRP